MNDMTGLTELEWAPAGNHELLWIPLRDRPRSRSYCRCGWICPAKELHPVDEFVNHLESLN